MSQSTHWTKARDQHLKDHYNDLIKVCPAILAMSLGLAEITVIKRLQPLIAQSARRTQRAEILHCNQIRGAFGSIPVHPTP